MVARMSLRMQMVRYLKARVPRPIQYPTKKRHQKYADAELAHVAHVELEC